MRWEVATKFLPGKFRMQAGPRLRVGEPYIDAAVVPSSRRPPRRAAPTRWPGRSRLVVEGLTAGGTPDEVARRIERYREAGVKLPIVRPAAAAPDAADHRHSSPRAEDCEIT